MLINIIMGLAFLAGVVSFWHADGFLLAMHRWDGLDIVRHQHARRLYRRWLFAGGASLVVFCITWWIGT